MIGFVVGAGVLLALALFFLLWPLRRASPDARIDRKALNAAIYRDELAELKRDLAEGALSQQDFDEAYAELQKRLLEDAEPEAAPASAGNVRTLALSLAAGLPVFAILLYFVLGEPQAIEPPPAAKRHQFTAADIERMVQGLAERLEKEPENVEGWFMLARSYKALGKFDAAARAYERIEPQLANNPDGLIDYADALAAARGGFDAKVMDLIARALTLDPNHLQALWMRGTAHYEAKRYAEALADWKKLRELLPAGSEEAAALDANLEELKTLMRGNTAKAKETAAVESIGGRVLVDRTLLDRLSPNDTVMIIARPADGTKMPIAVWRAPANRFPVAFTLDDSLALMPERRLSQFAQIALEARISKSGQAQPQTGDLYGEPRVVRLGEKNVELVIDRVRP